MDGWAGAMNYYSIEAFGRVSLSLCVIFTDLTLCPRMLIFRMTNDIRWLLDHATLSLYPYYPFIPGILIRQTYTELLYPY